MTLGTKRAARGGHAQHFERAGPVRQAADEAAFLERHDQAVNARFGAQVERVLHFVEGGRHTGLLHSGVDETEQFALLFRQHDVPRRLNPACQCHRSQLTRLGLNKP
jgi:hypothetical protein